MTLYILQVSSPVWDPLPGMRRHLDSGLGDPGILGHEVSGESQPELLGASDPVLLGQYVHGVLLAVRGDDVGVVPGLVILEFQTNQGHPSSLDCRPWCCRG